MLRTLTRPLPEGDEEEAGGSDTSLDKLKFVLQIVCAESELPEQLGVHLRRRTGQVDGSRHGVRHLGCYSSASVSGTTEALSRSVCGWQSPVRWALQRLSPPSRTRLLTKPYAETPV